MGGFKINFLVGLLVGAVVAILAPLAGADLIAALSAPVQATTTGSAITKEALGPQSVNRATKSDRLHPLNATNEVREPRRKLPRIPEGCDPAFSPLTRNGAADFLSRCLS
jgi:hypothetical protein